MFIKTTEMMQTMGMMLLLVVIVLPSQHQWFCVGDSDAMPSGACHLILLNTY
jgi:hypothetical protein